MPACDFTSGRLCFAFPLCVICLFVCMCVCVPVSKFDTWLKEAFNPVAQQASAALPRSAFVAYLTQMEETEKTLGVRPGSNTATGDVSMHWE